MSFGGGPKVPEAPEVQKTANFESNISGVRRRVVEGPDGRETIIEERMPLSPEEQQFEQQLIQLRNDNLETIERLSGVAAASDIPEFAETMDAFRRVQLKGLETSQEAVTIQQEEALARRGIESGTAGTELRDVRERAFVGQRQNVEDQTRIMGEDLRGQAIGRAQNLFGLATGRQDVQFAQLANTFARGQSGALAQTQMTNQANQQAFSNQLQVSQMQAQNKQAGLGSLSSLAGLGMLAAGPMGFGLLGATSGAKTGFDAAALAKQAVMKEFG